MPPLHCITRIDADQFALCLAERDPNNARSLHVMLVAIGTILRYTSYYMLYSVAYLGRDPSKAIAAQPQTCQSPRVSSKDAQAPRQQRTTAKKERHPCLSILRLTLP
jgi:hypothetical protein